METTPSLTAEVISKTSKYSLPVYQSIEDLHTLLLSYKSRFTDNEYYQLLSKLNKVIMNTGVPYEL